MNISELKSSKFLKKEDVGKGLLLTITEVRKENIAKQGDEDQLKWLMFFEEVEKPLILHSTNGQLASAFLGSEESDDWIGKQIVLYTDPTIAYAGKVVGGIRVRAPRDRLQETMTAKPPAAKAAPKNAPTTPPKPQALTATAPPDYASASEEDDVPF